MSDYRWIEGPFSTDEEWQHLDHILEEHGFMSLHRETSRILVKEEDGEVVGFICMQALLPHLGPLWVDKSKRGDGTAMELSRQMIDMLKREDARGWLVIVRNPVVNKMCEELGMKRLEYPVYVAGGM